MGTMLGVEMDSSWRVVTERSNRSPSSALGGVRHFMLVVAMMCCRKAATSVKLVLMATLFSHSNSAHMFRNCADQRPWNTCQRRATSKQTAGNQSA